MARLTKDVKKDAKRDTPDDMISDLKAQKMSLAVEMDKAENEMENAYDRLGIAEPTGPNKRGQDQVRQLPEGELTIPERRQIAGELRRLGREHEPLEQIDAEERELFQVIKANGPAIPELKGSMARLADEVETLKVEHRDDYFIPRNEDRSRAAEAQTDKLLAVINETKPVFAAVWDGWAEFGIPISQARDLLDVFQRELEEVLRKRLWPGGSEKGWHEMQAREQLAAREKALPNAPSPSSPEAPIEFIGPGAA